MLYVHPEIYDAVWIEGTEYKVDHHLIFALIMQESGFRPHAVGDNNRSFGLMQLNLDGAGGGWSVESLLDVNLNVVLGVATLRRCLNAFPDDVRKGIAAYRQGIQGVINDGPEVSESYVDNILALQTRYKQYGVIRYPPTRSWAYEGDGPF